MKVMRHGVLTAGLLDGKDVKANNSLFIQDITLRDGHQSLFATRGRTEDLIPVAELLDEVGFHSLEVWGGATFDTMHRFLAEDPWERIRTLKRHARKTPFSMLLRGQNLVGYRNYPDDVAEAFVERACENGMDIFRVFDALNDFRNFDTVVRVIKENGRHFQGAICYSLTEPRMGGSVYNLDYYLTKAKELESLGADTICIKDMAGLLAPYDAYALVKALKQTVCVPIHLHSHFTSGMADMTMLKAVEAGVDIVDTCMSPWAYRTSHPAVEPLVATLMHTSRETGLDLSQLARCSEHLEKVSSRYRHLLDDRTSIIDINVLLHQTPGGMISNLVSQLKEMDALERLDEVFRQLPRVRKELGQVPLVTPTSQIVGIQAVNNVLFDTGDERYRMITEQVKDLCYGLYGRTAVPVDPGVQAKALKGYPRGEDPITLRPADVLEPELEKVRNETEGLARDIDDVLICALYPTTGKRFLRWKYGLEKVPAETKPSCDPEAKARKPAGEKGPDTRTFRIHMNGESFEVDVEQIGGEPLIASSQTPRRKTILDLSRRPGKDTLAYASPGAARQERPTETAPQANSPSETPVLTPMPGMVVSYRVQEGDRVSRGDVVVVLEAMKMENYITAPVDGTVCRITLGEGANAKKGDVLALIA